MPTTTAGPSAKSLITSAQSGQLKLPSIPRVVTNLISHLKSPTASINQLTTELEQEPVLAARVLRMANSPFFCGRRTVGSISEAVAAIGSEALKTLVISCGITGVFVEVPGVNMRQFWREATLTAYGARELAGLVGQDGNVAYLCGLMHRIGYLILCQSNMEAAQQLPDAWSRGDAWAAELAEIDAFGLSHRDVGAAWLDSLALPMEVIQAVRHYLDPAPEQSLWTSLVLRTATQWVAAMDRGEDAAQAVAKLDAGVLQALHLDLAQSTPRLEKIYVSLARADIT